MKTQALVPARLEFFPRLANSPLLILPALALAGGMITGARAEELTLATAPPVVIRTVPAAGATDIDPSLTELQVTFNKDMQDRSWSWSTWGQENFPETTGSPRYLEDHRTCVLPVKLGPGKFYATWLNSHKFTNFKDASGNSAVPYLLTFQTAGAPKGGGGGGSAGVAPAAAASTAAAQVLPGGPLDEDQLVILKWTETSFRSFFDSRTFDGWSEKERTELETRLIDTLKGPQNREYYQAINSLGALRSKTAVQPLLAIATDRAEKDCRDRWMAVRALGLIGDDTVVPHLAHLVYHGNANTRWWAQISLVRLTQTNFGMDVAAWGNWWTQQGKQPAFNPERVVWNKGPEYSDPEKLKQILAESDGKFLESLKSKGF